jgi:hypothetical protein
MEASTAGLSLSSEANIQSRKEKKDTRKREARKIQD